MKSETEILERCAKCGQCRSVCPVFAELKDEALVARGRLAVIKEQIPLSSYRAQEIIGKCLMCLRCEVNCPSGVKTGQVFKSARAQAVRANGLPLPIWLGFNWVLPHRWLYDLVMKVLRLFTPLMNSSALPLGSVRPLRHLPLALGDLTARIPRLAKKPALDSYLPQRHREHRGDKPNVAVFIGCAINYIYPQVLGDTIKVLDKLGMDYYIPQNQLCCGLPALLSGDVRTARRLAQQNIKAFKDADIVLTACASCGRMLKEEYPLLTTKTQRTQSNPKILDIMEFCLERQPATYNSALITHNSVYHKPCHSAGNNSPEMIRSFLRKTTVYRESETDQCCGGGGLFGFKYPQLSTRIGKTRLAQIPHSTSLVTNCPGCMMQIEYLLKSNNQAHITVKHAISVFAEVL